MRILTKQILLTTKPKCFKCTATPKAATARDSSPGVSYASKRQGSFAKGQEIICAHKSGSSVITHREKPSDQQMSEHLTSLTQTCRCGLAKYGKSKPGRSGNVFEKIARETVPSTPDFSFRACGHLANLEGCQNDWPHQDFGK